MTYLVREQGIFRLHDTIQEQGIFRLQTTIEHDALHCFQPFLSNDLTTYSIRVIDSGFEIIKEIVPTDRGLTTSSNKHNYQSIESIPSRNHARTHPPARLSPPKRGT